MAAPSATRRWLLQQVLVLRSHGLRSAPSCAHCRSAGRSASAMAAMVHRHCSTLVSSPARSPSSHHIWSASRSWPACCFTACSTQSRLAQRQRHGSAPRWRTCMWKVRGCGRSGRATQIPALGEPSGIVRCRGVRRGKARQLLLSSSPVSPSGCSPRTPLRRWRARRLPRRQRRCSGPDGQWHQLREAAQPQSPQPRTTHRRRPTRHQAGLRWRPPPEAVVRLRTAAPPAAATGVSLQKAAQHRSHLAT